MLKSDSQTYTVLEHFFQSKTGDLDACEDVIHISENFFAVIDGETSKASRTWNGESSGKLCAKTVSRALSELHPGCSAREACALMTTLVADIYRKFNLNDLVQNEPLHRIGASFIALNRYKNELWSVGDCQFILGDDLFSPHKKIDQLLSETRSLFLEIELLNGATMDQLQDRDTGRNFILPLLNKQCYLQNNPHFEDYWYPIINGITLPDNGIIVTKIPDDIDTIVMASDGYPYLRKSLIESENMLEHILRDDPLLIRKYKSTKGLVKGNISFDDRAFIKIGIQRR